MPSTAVNIASTQLIEQLGHVCRDRGLPDLATRLASLHSWVQDDLRGFEAELAVIARGERVVQQAAHHLLDLGGKHLRPMCVALAAKLGAGFDHRGRDLAVAVELVHTATLLHDDVVDLGERRRGAPAARMVYGNAASVFAGDWLLIEALRRVRSAKIAGLLDRMLGIIEEMIFAESLQLERRGSLAGSIDDYFRVVEGKTAALFRWAMYAGARAGGLDDRQCEALESYGLHLGVAFQVVDDYLDFAGSSDITGKSLFADLREGKVTYPVLLALSREPALADTLAAIVGDEGDVPETAARAVAASLERTGALRDSRQLARDRVDRALASLDCFDDGPAKTALITVAQATAHRER